MHTLREVWNDSGLRELLAWEVRPTGLPKPFAAWAVDSEQTLRFWDALVPARVSLLERGLVHSTCKIIRCGVHVLLSLGRTS